MKNIKINIAIVLCILVVSCSIQSRKEILDCRESYDLNNKVYQINCFKKTELLKVFYVDTLGYKYELAKNIDSSALLFDTEEDFLEFVNKEFIWNNQKNVEGRIYVALYIDENAIILDKRILRGVDGCPECTESVLELVSKIIPKKAAYCKGKSVKSIEVISILLPQPQMSQEYH